MKFLPFYLFFLHSVCFSQFVLDSKLEIEKEFFNSGKLNCIKSLKEGVQHGKTVFCFESGEKRIEQNYKEGKAHGKVFWYHQNGQIGWEENYNEGIPVGKWFYYSNEGTVQAVEEFKEGNEVSYFSKGEKIRAD